MTSVFGLAISMLPVFAQFYNVSTVAGNGRNQIEGVGGLALSARLVSPRSVAVDSAGNILVSDSYFHQVFKINAAGSIAIFAGTGTSGFSGDGGAAASARLNGPEGIALDGAGNLYIADRGNGRIRKVTPAGEISTFATVAGASNLAIDPAGNVYVSQTANNTVTRVRTDGTSSVIAGNGTAGFSGDGAAATAAMLFGPRGVAVDTAGNVFVADAQNNRIRRISPQGTISTVVGDGQPRLAGDGAAAASASVSTPSDIAIDAANTMYISDTSSARLRVVNASGIISTAAGGGLSLDDGLASTAFLPGIAGIALDGSGRVVMAVNFIRQVKRYGSGAITTIAGTLPTGNTGDNLPATEVSFLSPRGLAVDANGEVLVADTIDNRVRKIRSAGTITSVAGSGIYGPTTSGAQAATTPIGNPTSLSFDTAGNFYVGAGFGATIHRVTPANVIGVYAGGNGAGSSGDGGQATAARMLAPGGTVTDAAGNLYIADTDNHRIRRVSAAGIITTIAGSTPGFSGDNGPALNALFLQPRDLALDAAGNLYVADSGNARVRKIAPSGVITTVAGNGNTAFSGDNGPATEAGMTVTAIAVDKQGDLYIGGGVRVRKVKTSSGIVTTIAGNGNAGFSGDGGLATNASFSGVSALAADASGAIYVADGGNLRVRKLTPAQIVSEGVANGGTLRAGPVAPGEIITIYGYDIGPATPQGLQVGSDGKVTTQLGGTQVFFDGVAAPLTYVSSGQVNAIVPYGVAGAASTVVKVVFQGKETNTITLPVEASSPGIFAITNQDGQVNTAANPAASGSVLILYATGEGQTNPAGVDGAVANSVYPKPILPVTVQIGTLAGNVQYAGAAPGFVSGVLQVNVQIPASVHGTVPLQLKIGTAATPTGINVSVR